MKVLKSTCVIDSFNGRFRFLSNFWPAEVELDGVKYKTVEHAYQAAKTKSAVHRRMIRRAATPANAKRIGKMVPLRTDWMEIKIDVMKDLVRQKFTNNKELKRKLLYTGNAQLIEGNNWGDRFWGVCRGDGQNNLGKILMKARSELRKTKKKKGK